MVGRFAGVRSWVVLLWGLILRFFLKFIFWILFLVISISLIGLAVSENYSYEGRVKIGSVCFSYFESGECSKYRVSVGEALHNKSVFIRFSGLTEGYLSRFSDGKLGEIKNLKANVGAVGVVYSCPVGGGGYDRKNVEGIYSIKNNYFESFIFRGGGVAGCLLEVDMLTDRNLEVGFFVGSVGYGFGSSYKAFNVASGFLAYYSLRFVFMFGGALFGFVVVLFSLLLICKFKGNLK